MLEVHETDNLRSVHAMQTVAPQRDEKIRLITHG